MARAKRFPWFRASFAAPAVGVILSLALLPFARGDDLLFVIAVIAAYLLVLALVNARTSAATSRSAFLFERLEMVFARVETALRAGPAAVILLISGMTLYALVWSTLSILRHEALNSSGFDLAIQHQVVWNLAHGRGFESSIEVANYLGDHVALTLPLFAPFLWIWDDVRMLLIVQSIVLSLGAIPVHRLARRHLAPLDALVWAGVYLLTPAIGFMNKYDFHDIVVAVPFLLAAVEAIDAGRLRASTFWLLLAAATREEVGLTVAALGIWTALARRKWRWGIPVAIVACAWSVTALFVVLPHYRGGDGSDTIARYAWLGNSPGEIARTLLTEPWRLFASHYHRVRRVVFWIQLLLPFGGTPLLAPGRLACAVPNLGLSITSGAISQNSIYFQYNAAILPILFWSGIEGMRKLRVAVGPRSRILLFLVFSVAAANFADPAAIKSLGRPYTIVDGIRPRANREAFRRAAGLVPSDADILASNDLAPHLSERRRLHVAQFLRPNPATRWILLDVTDTRHLESKSRVAGLIAGWWRDDGYRVRFFSEGILLLEQAGQEDPPGAARLASYLASMEKVQGGVLPSTPSAE